MSPVVLPRDRAFVVQLADESEGALEGLAGRVEHVASGQATHFQTADECLAFIARVLRRPPGAGC